MTTGGCCAETREPFPARTWLPGSALLPGGRTYGGYPLPRCNTRNKPMVARDLADSQGATQDPPLHLPIRRRPLPRGGCCTCCTLTEGHRQSGRAFCAICHLPSTTWTARLPGEQPVKYLRFFRARLLGGIGQDESFMIATRWGEEGLLP